MDGNNKPIWVDGIGYVKFYLVPDQHVNISFVSTPQSATFTHYKPFPLTRNPSFLSLDDTRDGEE